MSRLKIRRQLAQQMIEHIDSFKSSNTDPESLEEVNRQTKMVSDPLLEKLKTIIEPVN